MRVLVAAIRPAACVSLALTVLAGAAAAQSAEPARELRLRPGDAVRVEVADEPQLAGEYSVGEDGSVLLPLVGLVRAAGRPFADVEAEIRAAYRSVLLDQSLRLTPLLRIAVLGEVRLPGLYPVDGTFGVPEVLALAGGLLPTADESRVLVLRNGEEVYRSGATDASAFRLASGDRVVVHGRSWFRENLSIFVSAAASVTAAAVTAILLR